jgi:hypothetical protein
MRHHYFSEFLLGKSASSAPPSARDFAAMCRTWVDRDRAGITNRAAIPAELDVSNGTRQFQLGKQASLATVGYSDEKHECFALRLAHPDEKDASIRWTTEICFAADKVAGEGRVSVTTSIAETSGIVSPIAREASRPSIVRQIVEQWSAREHYPIFSTAVPLKNSGVDEFIAFLTSPQRRLPVLLVSARNFDDKPSVDADAIAEQVVALCHVVVAENRFPSLALRDRIPQSLNCWDGAVRIYWPHFKLTDHPFQHRLWTPNRIAEIEAEFGGGIKKHLLQMLSRIASARHMHAEASWDYISRLLSQKAMADLREAGDLADLLALMDVDLSELRQQVQSLQQQLSESRLSEEKATSEAESWRLAYVEAAKASRGQDADPMALENLPPTSVKEVVRRIQSEFEGRIVFALNGRSAVDDNPFEDTEGLYKALRFLGSTYYSARSGRQPCADLGLACRESSGFAYEPHQSEITIGMYKDFYTTRWNGKSVTLKGHVGKGSSKDPRYCIRVGFDFDEAKKIVVVGFIGQHQKTGAT